MKKHLFTFILLFASTFIWAQYNNVEAFTSANGLGNDACTALLVEPNGTLWVGHGFFGSPSLNGKPFSRRLPNGTWDYPFSSLGLPVITVSGSPYNWASFSVKEAYRTNDGSIWFIGNTANATDMNSAAPILKFLNGSFTAYHISSANFPNKGAVLTMVQDGAGDIWFGCQDGLIKLDGLTGNFSSYNPPVINFSGSSHASKRVFALDYDLNNKIVMLTGNPFSLANTSSLMRIYTPLTNTWEYWTHLDAPWSNAIQTFYVPEDLVATRNADNRVYLSTDGGGIYYVDNSAWSSNTLNQIANFVRGWSFPGFSFENIYTNLPDFTRNTYLDTEGELWVFGVDGYVYKKMYQAPTLFNGSPATYHLFGYKRSQHIYNNNGTNQHSPFQDMAFADNGEIWIASEHGLEHWYLDSLNPNGDYIGMEGVGSKKQGIVGFNTKTGNVVEPENTGHNMPTNWPAISIDTAYHYLASSDYDNLVAGQSAGITGTGVYRGFPNTAAALTNAGYDFSDLKLRFSAVSLGNDTRTVDWTWNDPLESRQYQTWFELNGIAVAPMSFYELVLNGQVLFRGQMPDLHLHINYNRYGYLFDSIGAYTDYIPLSPNPSLTDPATTVVRDSLTSDLDGKGIRFVFRTIQTALNEEIVTADRRGGFFRLYDAYLHKDTADAPPLPSIPMCGIYRIGQAINDDYATFSEAAAVIEARGMLCDVTFQVGKGSYNEQVELGTVEGMDLFSITFDGLGSIPTIRFAPNHADSNYIFKVSGTQNLHFKDIAFKNIGATYGGVFLLASPLNFSLDGCELEGLQNAPNSPISVAANHILFSGTNCDSLLIENSEFTAGADGIKSSGTSLEILDNEFSENTRTAIDLSRADDVNITANLILGSSGTFTGIKFGDHPFQINRNQIINANGNCTYAINSFSFDAGSALNPGQIWNNEISIQSTAGSGGAITLAVENVQVYHNSVKVSGNNSNYSGLDNYSMTAGWEARNNIIVNDNGYCVSLSTFNDPAVFPNSDYNIYYSNAANPFKIGDNVGTTLVANLAAFQAATSVDANSPFIDPQFADDQQLLVMNAGAKDGAVLLANLNNDILNRARPNVNRDNGCYEFDGIGWLGSINSDWRNSGNWSGNAIPTAVSKVFVSPRVNNPIIDTALHVREFMMHRQGSLIIRAGAGLKIDSLLSMAGEIILEADTAGKFGQLIQNQVSGNGSITQEVLLVAADSSLRWFHLGVPMRTKIANLANNGSLISAGRPGASIYYWDATLGNWVSPSDTGDYLEPGRGYVIAAGENAFGNFLVDSFPSILSYRGELAAATSALNATLGYTNVPGFNSYTSGVSDGWNLLANPYHAVYDLKGQSMPGSYKTIYMWDGSSYKQYNAQLDVGDIQARYLAPMQGFFIRVDSQSQSFSFDPAKRIISSGNLIQKSQGYPQFSLKVSGGAAKQSDHCYFVIHPLAGAQFEEAYDAVKLKNATDHLNFYSTSTSEKIAINSLNIKDLMLGVGLGFSAAEDTSFSISLSRESDFPFQVFLRDQMLNIDHRLDQQDYSFSHSTGNLEDRFFLYLRANEVGQAEMDSPEIYWSLKDGSIKFSNLPAEALTFRLMNLQGQEIHHSAKAAGAKEHLIRPNTSNQYDFLIVKIEELSSSFKVILN
jgi:hypothetical protein